LDEADWPMAIGAQQTPITENRKRDPSPRPPFRIGHVQFDAVAVVCYCVVSNG
jgi:hypothetical protein